jgi:hypothetical protein
VISRILRLSVLCLAIALTLLGAQRKRAVSPPSNAAGPTFSREVVRLFQQHCQSCHRPGDIAPFSLVDYESARPHALTIKAMTQLRKMPPWKPVDGCGDFDAARGLTQSEIDILAKWADAGAPEGNRADLPPPLVFNPDWQLGAPDLVLVNDEPYTPPADGDMYRCFSIPAKTISEQYVRAIDIRPGDRQSVHHVLTFIDAAGESLKLDEDDQGPGYACFGGPGILTTSTLGGWAPGARAFELPEGIVFSLPANARVVMQVHYHPHHGQPPRADLTQIGVYYSDVQPRKLMRIVPLVNMNFTIPPGHANYRVDAGIPFLEKLPAPVQLWAVAPHMHLLGRKMTVEATLPNESKSCLITIDDWDFNWQGMYRFREPISLPAGTKLAATSWFDNSANNPRNPNHPPLPVSWGEATTDEMCLAFLGITLDADDFSSGTPADAKWIPPLSRR